MTPFDSWYAANVEAKLPADFPPQLRAAGKAEAAKVWNAALDAVQQSPLHQDGAPVPGLVNFINRIVARLQVTP